MREDIKHLKAKLKKLGDKLTKDSAKAEVWTHFVAPHICCM